MQQATLAGGLIGNSAIGALVDQQANVVWACLPRFDADPVFCSLLSPPGREEGEGCFSILLADFAHAEQQYIDHTAVLRTWLHDKHGGCVEVVDFAPRFRLHGRIFHPTMLVRRVRKVAGNPRISIRLKPRFEYGAQSPTITFGSHHIRYVGPESVLRLTTNLSIHAVLEERPMYVHDTLSLILGPDETVQENVEEVARKFLEDTTDYWQDWVRTIFVPVDWQDEVIRAAITLKLNAFDDTGAIIAAMTTSVPEHPDSGRNWDYRYCWLRDAYFVVNALNRLGATTTMERYIAYILNVVAAAGEGQLQPVYGISGEADLVEGKAPALAGYRGMGPVRVGNQAYEQIQHDVYGSAVLAATHMFFDTRLRHRGDENLFRQLEPLGHKALANYNQPDAGIWELRGSKRVHTYSSVLCWAACDRLARIAAKLRLPESENFWREAADRIHADICAHAWNSQRRAFVTFWGGDVLDASLLLMHEFGFLEADDPRFAQTVAAIEGELKHGDFIYRYVERDDFGRPENAFLVCTFWYVYALHALGRIDEAQKCFANLLGCCNELGLLAEDIDPRTHEQWGNFVQTYSMVGLVNCALRLSPPWEQAY
ncbi:MAG: glucoamylase [Candidatus Dactylopiibacterium carminicum]|uniref:Glucoamylase n=1 Tax=Candidatus Dactylopiibacterium carminicum TaxID=857335 RepID=A0A272ERS5_9RHOO|nr:glycoside hydrolase family 15 protein [Candidatus Dactylopiibacterium carminicum]KAF7598888.1 glycoside hydrolase family 15 protein [Candidatus Dactylopiibacterium carminicum]PAS92813.1 MAG: glucoamylase [Candidatus Dactylopiibacterium carminicum]PAS96264.1 MAG: glucoamylase [Candidatus Dactylopiibacterium carminicum]PAS98906.1 MAG: glucoamylase [Candidatus Dactylopiibacterium carminicum]